MMNINKDQTKLSNALRLLLQEHQFSSQKQLMEQLSNRGFQDISQNKISRLIVKLGGIKAYQPQKKAIYSLPKKMEPGFEDKVLNLVTDIAGNDVQILLKTVQSGAKVVAGMIDLEARDLGVIGSLACDNTVLVIPKNTNEIGTIMENLRLLFNLKK